MDLDTKHSKSMGTSSFYGTLVIIPFVILWYMCGIASLTTSKLIVQHFDHPFLLSTIQFSCSSIAVSLYLRCRNQEKAIENGSLFSIVRVALSYTFGFIFINSALSFAAASFVETIRSAEPFTTVLLGYFLLKETASLRTYLTLIPICGGVAVSCNSTVASAFSLNGLLLTIGANLCFSLRSVFAKLLNRHFPSYNNRQINLFKTISMQGMCMLLPLTVVLEGYAICDTVLLKTVGSYGAVLRTAASTTASVGSGISNAQALASIASSLRTQVPSLATVAAPAALAAVATAAMNAATAATTTTATTSSSSSVSTGVGDVSRSTTSSYTNPSPAEVPSSTSIAAALVPNNNPLAAENTNSAVPIAPALQPSHLVNRRYLNEKASSHNQIVAPAPAATGTAVVAAGVVAPGVAGYRGRATREDSPAASGTQVIPTIASSIDDGRPRSSPAGTESSKPSMRSVSSGPSLLTGLLDTVTSRLSKGGGETKTAAANREEKSSSKGSSEEETGAEPPQSWASMLHDVAHFLGLVVFNGCAFASYNLLSYIVLQRTDLVTHSVLNVLRRVFTIVFTSLYFNVEMNLYNTIGVALAVTGVVAYGCSRARDATSPPSAAPHST